jgi:trans-2-enoyl-CoA reductase
MREEINYTDLEDYAISYKQIISQKMKFTDSYEDTLKMIDSLYQERLSLKKSLNRDEKIDIILDGMD